MQLLVTFDDITDPTTVRLADPANLSASFGPGVSLAGVTLEITRADVTEERVEAVLGWLCEHLTDADRSGSTVSFSSDALANRLNPGNLLIEKCK